MMCTVSRAGYAVLSSITLEHAMRYWCYDANKGSPRAGYGVLMLMQAVLELAML